MHICLLDHVNSSSDGGNWEGLSDSDPEQSLVATVSEKYLHGLLRGKEFSRQNVEVKMLPGGTGQRGAFATKSFHAGDYVCEYASCVKPKADSTADEKRYTDLGMYLL